MFDSTRRSVTVYRRTDAAWIVTLPQNVGVLELTSVPASLSLDDIYASVGL